MVLLAVRMVADVTETRNVISQKVIMYMVYCCIYCIHSIINFYRFFKPKPNLSLYSPHCDEACNEFAVPNFASLHQGNTATCVGIEAVANCLQPCLRFGRSGICTPDSRTRGTRVNHSDRGGSLFSILFYTINS